MEVFTWDGDMRINRFVGKLQRTGALQDARATARSWVEACLGDFVSHFGKCSYMVGQASSLPHLQTEIGRSRARAAMTLGFCSAAMRWVSSSASV